jgi:signal transduction histidine kinase
MLKAATFRILAALLCVVVAMFVSLMTSTHSPAAEVRPKRILILHSFGLHFKPWSDYAQAIRAEISQRLLAPVDFQDHSLLNARRGDDKSDRPFVEYLSSLYEETSLDLIIAIGAPAANFVQQYRDQLFPRTPMMFTAVEQRRVQFDKLTEYDTVVAVAHDFPAAFESILRVLPLTKTIAIVNGTSPNEKFWLGEMKRELAPLTERVELKWYDELSFESILKDAASLQPHSAIFWHLLNVDAAGVAHEANSALNKLSLSANAPIFSYDGSFFGEAIVGGPMHSVGEGSTIAAAVALRILDGEKAGDIKTRPVGFALPKYDWRQMQRWGIGERNLPPGSEILFREPGAWERYRWQLVAMFAIVLLQALTISGLLYGDHRRRLAEGEAKQRLSELAHVNRFSTAGELTASIAHEMNQPLGTILANVEALQLILESPTPDMNEMRDIAGEIRRDDLRAADVIQRLRSLLKKAPFEVRPVDFNEVVRDSIGLLSSQTAALKVDVSAALSLAPLPVNGDRIQLQQVILNLILNAMDAMSNIAAVDRRLVIWTSLRDEFAEVSIADAGPGVPAERLNDVFEPFFTTKPNGMGMGLSIARTIIQAHHGTISAHNQAKGGAVFRVRLPLRTS